MIFFFHLAECLWCVRVCVYVYMCIYILCSILSMHTGDLKDQTGDLLFTGLIFFFFKAAWTKKMNEISLAQNCTLSCSPFDLFLFVLRIISIIFFFGMDFCHLIF